MEKELNSKIKRVNTDKYTNEYIYKFTSKQLLEKIDDYSDMTSYSYDEIKQFVIESLILDFRTALESIVFKK